MKSVELVVLSVTSFFFLAGSGVKHFHNLNVSSAPADKIVLPSGDRARCNTLAVWPISSVTCKSIKNYIKQENRSVDIKKIGIKRVQNNFTKIGIKRGKK